MKISNILILICFMFVLFPIFPMTVHADEIEEPTTEIIQEVEIDSEINSELNEQIKETNTILTYIFGILLIFFFYGVFKVGYNFLDIFF